MIRKRIRVEFEDHGQDLLWVEIGIGVHDLCIIKDASTAGLYAASLIGKYVDYDTVTVGGNLAWLDFERKCFWSIKYPIKQIIELTT